VRAGAAAMLAGLLMFVVVGAAGCGDDGSAAPAAKPAVIHPRAALEAELDRLIAQQGELVNAVASAEIRLATAGPDEDRQAAAERLRTLHAEQAANQAKIDALKARITGR